MTSGSRTSDLLPPDDVTRARMQRQRRRDTDAEMAVRRLVHASGERYRVDFAPIPGMRCRADLVFTRPKVAVFVDGCFWHGCPEHGSSPKSNADWWRDKISANRRRDSEADRRLTEHGWTVVRVWEHEDAAGAAARIIATVRRLRSP